MKPLIFIDLETTGLDAAVSAPIAIAALVLGGDRHNTIFHARMRPFDGAFIHPMALAVNGYSEEDIQRWPCPARTCDDFLNWIADTCPAPQLVTPAGWNYKFDERFLREWIYRHVPDAAAYYGNTFAEQHIECMNVVKGVYPEWKKHFGSMKLTNVFELLFSKALKDAHTELADCYATRDIFLHCDSICPEPSYSQYHA